MAKVHVEAKPDFLEGLTFSARPINALAELVWNGFDAGSEKVQVFFDFNDMDGIKSIRIRDSGRGIQRSEIETLFGNLGASWKKGAARANGRALHGKNGKGRFKAFALGDWVEWNTTYRIDNKTYKYKITGKFLSLDDFDVTDPLEVTGHETGTEVFIQNPKQDFRSLRDASAPIELAKIFGAYLTQYPGLVFEHNGDKVDPESVQKNKKEYFLGDVPLGDGRSASVAISIVEWATPTDRILHLCDGDGITLHDLAAGTQIRAPGFNFTAYVKSSLFRDLDSSNALAIAELHPDVQAVLKVVRNKIKEHFRLRTLEDQGKVIERWKEEKIYPYEDTQDIGPVEEAERQVFDILAVNVQSYLPSFDEADTKSKKFTFRLLAQAVKENPDSIQEIISEVLGLKKDEQDDLADLLKKTPLSSIISSAKIVANRLDFLLGLDALLFDKATKKIFLERDQLHKILEQEAWIFHEEFGLAGSEQRLEEVLNIHLEKLGKREDDPEPVLLEGGKTGRIDLMLQKATQPRTGEYDYLVVELKRPSKKITSEVLSQIESYAIAVANDERFKNTKTKWTFIAISNEMDEHAERKANQRHRPKGLVFDDSELNIVVWAKTWSEVINDAKSRLQFVNKQLSYEANRDSSSGYLKKAHAKFIPDINQVNKSTKSAASDD
jgi:Histidine kinase-, DNA gyrase B-, and HSP90-like ATPase